MGLIEDFVGRYGREYDFYDQAARLVSQLLDVRVRAMVTFRAKAVGRLEAKARDRAQKKTYSTVEELFADIPDLAGVRVALYFPAQREQVGLVIDELFVVTSSKAFPDGTAPNYNKRFSGYSATHHRVRLRESTLIDGQKRYGEASVEIQVGSVFMHAWAEVEHDLVYKPHQGVLSEDEYAILDELNGMVLAGELALERLQRAGEARVAVRGRTFANHYELAAHLLRELREFANPSALQAGLGRVDLLYELLSAQRLANPEAVAQYLKELHPDLERRPIADQIVDQLLSEDSQRYGLYEHLRGAGPSTVVAALPPGTVKLDEHEAVGEFLTAWIDLDRLIRQLASSSSSARSPMVPTTRLLTSIGGLDGETSIQYEHLRRMRNHVVHGTEILAPDDLREAARQLRVIRARLVESQSPGL